MNVKKMKIRVKLLLVMLIVFMVGCHTNNAVTVKAEQDTTEQEIAGETEGKEEEETEEPGEDTEDSDAYTMIAHRGYSRYAPENSLPAFEKAVAAGFTTIELDLRRCKPDANGRATWVVSHADSLADTMGVNKNISNLTYSQLLTYSYTKGNEIDAYKDLKIVSYEQIISLIKQYKGEGRKITWQIEIKNAEDSNYEAYFEEELIRPLVEAQLQEDVIFSSFNSSYLQKIKFIDSSLRTWYLSTVLNIDAMQQAKSCQAEGISFKGTSDYTSEQNVRTALQEGFQLCAYTVNSPVVMGVYHQWGVRNFSTDSLAPIDVSKNMLTGTYNLKAFTCTLEKDSYTYDGTRRLPKVTVTYRGEELVEGINYTLSYFDNKNPGTARVCISGINNCKEEQERTFAISLRKVTGFQIAASKANYIKLSWTKTQNVTGYIIYQYNFTTKKYEAIKTIRTSSKVSYKVKNLTSATKYRFIVRAYLESDGEIYLSDASAKKVTYTKPQKVKIKSLQRYKKYRRLRVKWTAVPRCTGYVVKIATDKKMKNIVGTYTVKGKKHLKWNIKKLSRKTTYYVKVRAYRKAGKTTYNGAYSSVKKIKGKTKSKSKSKKQE